MLTGLANFRVQCYLSYKALSWGGLTAYVWNRLIRPILFVVMFALVGRFAGDPAAADFYVIGMAAVAIPATILDGVLPMFVIERNQKLLPVLFVSSGSRVVILWSRGLLHFLNGFVSLSVSLLFAAVFLHLDLSRTNWPLLACSAALIGASSTAFGLFAGNFALVLREWTNLSALLQGGVIALAGAVIPAASLPDPLRWVAQLLPMTTGLTAFRGAFTGAGFEHVASALLGELALGLAYAAAGALLFGFFEAASRRRGTLEWEAA